MNSDMHSQNPPTFSTYVPLAQSTSAPYSIDTTITFQTKCQFPLIQDFTTLKPNPQYELDLKNIEERGIKFEKTTPAPKERPQRLNSFDYPNKHKSFPYSAIVSLVLNFGTKAFASGVMVGPRHVLTATSALRLPNKKSLPKQILAIPGRDGNKLPFGVWNVEGVHIFHEEAPMGDDMALLVLDGDIGNYTGWFGILSQPNKCFENPTELKVIDEDIREDGLLHVTGYDFYRINEVDPTINRPPVLFTMKGKFISNLETAKFEEKLLAYQIDTEIGQAGAPVYQRLGPNYFVVGVNNTCSRLDKKIVCNVGTKIDPIKFETILKWMSEKNVLKFPQTFQPSFNQSSPSVKPFFNSSMKAPNNILDESKELDQSFSSDGKSSFGGQTPKYLEGMQSIIIYDRKISFVSQPDYIANGTPYGVYNSNYFKFPKKFLHFFQQGTNILHLIDLDQAERAQKYEFAQLRLAIDFMIPSWHQSLITPPGEVYLSGGCTFIDGKNKILASLYRYEHSLKTLFKLKDMSTPRYGHAFVYLQGFLYVIGGFTSKGPSNKCEKYDIKQNKWTDIKKLNVPAMHCCACAFNDRFIYKFGGNQTIDKACDLVERYNPDLDKWTIIEFKIPQNVYSHHMLSLSGCTQINNDTIFVFGGTDETYSIKSNQSAFLKIEDVLENKKTEILKDGHRFEAINKFLLPEQGIFKNPQAVVHENKMFCLQNITDKQDEKKSYNHVRRLLAYDENGWQTLAE